MKPENNKSEIRILRGWIKFNLSLKGLTLKDLGEKYNCTSLCIVFHRPFPRAEKIIADTLNLEPQTLWPDRYDSTGRPNRRNTWYDRKRGGWKPKRITKRASVKENLKNKKREIINGAIDKERVFREGTNF